MGIYVFSPRVLQELLDAYPDHNDFGREIIPAALARYRIAAHVFRGYWEDIGTMSAFYRANLSLAVKGEYSLYDPDFPLYTHPRYLSPTNIDDAHIETSLIAEGSLIGKARISRSVVGIRSRIADGVELDGALVMGNDEYETSAERDTCRAAGVPPLGIGAGTVVRKAIIDKQTRIGRQVRIVNSEGLEEFDGRDYYIREGIVIIPRDAVIPDSTLI
jgi:glucose-1-phosphate adenylyltransferase